MTGASGSWFGRRGLVVGVALVLLIAVGAGVFVFTPLGRDNVASDGRVRRMPPATQPALATSTVQASAAPTASVASPAAETPVVSPAAVVEFTCWDGVVVSALEQCPRPTTDAEAHEYLKYVFPGLAGMLCKPLPTSSARRGVAAYFECRSDGFYLYPRYWSEIDQAQPYYDEKAVRLHGAALHDVQIGETPVVGWVRTFDRDTAKGRRALSMLAPQLQLSLTVEGKSTSTLFGKFDTIAIRPPGEMLGHASGVAPTSALLRHS